jgi:hypothetical protein
VCPQFGLEANLLHRHFNWPTRRPDDSHTIKETAMMIAIKPSRVGRLDMKLEVIIIPVADVDRAKQFYGGMGWRLDAMMVSA